MRDMGSPAITLRCDCGAEGRAAYGEVWKCSKCGRSYNTSQIPAEDYDAVAALDRRYRWGNRALMAVLAEQRAHSADSSQLRVSALTARLCRRWTSGLM